MVIDSGKYKIPILYEDEYLIVVIKPYNLLIQKDKTNDISLYDIIKQYLNNNFTGIVHRLDKVIYGIVVFAKTSKTAKNLFTQIQSKQMTKIYHALVEGQLEEKRTLEHYILKKNQRALVFSIPKLQAKKSILHYHVIEQNESKALLEINLETGRYNQIRAQLAYIRHPIVNDFKYKKDPQAMTCIALIAKKLSFHHPISGKFLSFEIPYPKKWQTFL